MSTTSIEAALFILLGIAAAVKVFGWWYFRKHNDKRRSDPDDFPL